jgi:hypothetical protein
MKALAALLLVLCASALRYLWQRRSGILIALAALAGICYSLRLENRTAGAILVCYFALEIGKGLGRRGNN